MTETQTPQISGEQPQARPLIIDVQGVECSFHKRVGVFDLTFQVPRGIIFGLIGPSGCGKTTTVRMLNGLYKLQKGNLSVMGTGPDQFSARTRETIGYIPQQFVLYPNLSVMENLNFVASLYGMGYLKRRARLKQLLDFVELTDARNRLASQLSGGMQRRLQLACALVNDPQLLFADEPTAGIDPILRDKFWKHFRDLRDQGRTLFVTTQYVGEAEYCDIVGVMLAGRMVVIDTPERLRRKAFGGDIIKLTVDASRAMDCLQLLDDQPSITHVERSRTEPNVLFAHCGSAAEALPLVLGVLQEQHGIKVQEVEKYMPPFDEVFVMLMRQAGDVYA